MNWLGVEDIYKRPLRHRPWLRGLIDKVITWTSRVTWIEMRQLTSGVRSQHFTISWHMDSRYLRLDANLMWQKNGDPIWNKMGNASILGMAGSDNHEQVKIQNILLSLTLLILLSSLHCGYISTFILLLLYYIYVCWHWH